MDGRLGDDKQSDQKSIKSQVSRAISIRARTNSAVGYSQRQVKDPNLANKNKAQALVMQSFAINLRQKHEYARAKQLL
jgi:hypothetical protein